MRIQHIGNYPISLEHEVTHIGTRGKVIWDGRGRGIDPALWMPDSLPTPVFFREKLAV